MNNDEKDYSAGVLSIKSAGQIVEAENEKIAKSLELENGFLELAESRLAAHIRNVWENNKNAKFKINDRLINCMQLRKGVYDSTKLAQIRQQGGSEIFMKLTATKCRAAAAWIKDVILPSTHKSWGIKPTPLADIPQDKIKELEMAAEETVASNIKKQIEQAQQDGQEITQELMIQFDIEADKELEKLKSEVETLAQKDAKAAAGKMETKIEDQLAEGDWHQAMEEYIEDFVTFPAAILKGPILRKRKTLAWEGSNPVVKEEIIPTFTRVSPFNIFPSPEASETWHGDLVELLPLRRGDIYSLKGVDGYSDKDIDAVLDEYGRGGLREWMFNDAERADLEDKNIWHKDDNLIHGLHFWGSVQGKLLLEWGLSIDDIKDPLDEFHIDAILIGRHVIRAKINPDPMDRRPYHKANFQRVQGSFWGLCPPELMEDIQNTCNATARALINNLAMSSGPMVGYNTDRIVNPGDIQVRPWKTFEYVSDSQGMGSKVEPPVHFFQPRSNASEMLNVYNQFEQKADDATNIPRYMYGNEKIGGAGATMGGLSMLMDSASKGIRAAIRHIDLYTTRPAIEQVWFYNMLKNDDEEMMGDSKVIAVGVNGVIARDQQHAQRMQVLANTANPLDMEIIGKSGRRDLLDESFKHMGLEGIVPAKETFERESQEQQPPSLEQQKQAVELEKAQIELQKSQIELEKMKGAGDVVQ